MPTVGLTNRAKLVDAQRGLLRLHDAEVRALARVVLDEPAAEVDSWSVEPVDYAFGSPTTGGLFRIRGSAGSGAVPWSAFVKLVHSYRHWPLLDVLPAELRMRALSSSAWRYEADVYRGRVAEALPDGLRLPRVYRVHELGDDRIAVILEDVASAATGWDSARFGRAARLLGRLAVRLTRSDALPSSALRSPGEVTGLHYTGRLLVAALPALQDDATWRHPLLAHAADPKLRADVLELARRVPTVLTALARLPQLMVHGDASPQNLLVPANDPDSFVAIDWTLGGLAAVGDDLGQLLVGLAHADQLPTAELPGLREVLVPAYTAGLAVEGMLVDQAAVGYGLDGGLVVRSAFTALPLERLAEPITEELAELFSTRARLTRYLVDLGLALPASPAPGTDARTNGKP